MPAAKATSRSTAKDSGRRRASHSMETVVGEAVALLDEAGVPALTFRALAARLGGGVGSIYWYVDGKDELLDRATDHVLGQVLAETERFTDAADPIDDLRSIALAVFDLIVERPWLSSFFMRSVAQRPNGLLLYERLGQQVLRLDLSPRDSFHAVSAVLGFVIGIAADLIQEPPPEVLESGDDRDQFLSRFADEWRAKDPADFPFLHHVVEEFDGHDDVEQFRAGLDLLLDGLRLQADR